MKKIFRLFFLAGFLFTLSFCSNKTTTEKTVDDVGDAIEETAEDAEDAIEEAADDVEDELD